VFGPPRARDDLCAARVCILGQSRVDLVLSWLFVAALATPLVTQIVRRDHSTVLAAEYRIAAPPPGVPSSFRDVLRFPESFQAFYDDSYGWRETLLASDAFVRLRVFGVSPARGVVVGRNGWLFLNAGRAMEVSLGYVTPGREHVERWTSVLAERQRWYAQHGIAYVFAFAPNKEEIYPEHVPAGFARTGPSVLDAFVACAQEHDVTCYLDLRPALYAEKARGADDDPLYHPGDTHWTARGGWAACNALLARLHASVPALEPAPRESLAARRVSCLLGDLDREVGRPNSLETMPAFAPQVARARETAARQFPKLERRFAVDDPSLPRVLFVHDSFGAHVDEPLAEHCSELTSLCDYSLSEDVVEAMQPDAVIQLYTERAASGEPMPPYSDLRRLSAEECAAVRMSFDVDGPEAARRLLVPHGGTRIETDEADGPDAFAIETSGDADTFATPAIELAPGAHPILHADVTCPSPTVMSVFYMTLRARRHDRARVCPIALKAGRNDVCFELLVDGVDGPLLVRPANEPGRCVLRRFAIGSSVH
jgi:hypothetical protein